MYRIRTRAHRKRSEHNAEVVPLRQGSRVYRSIGSLNYCCQRVFPVVRTTRIGLTNESTIMLFEPVSCYRRWTIPRGYIYGSNHEYNITDGGKKKPQFLYELRLGRPIGGCRVRQDRLAGDQAGHQARRAPTVGRPRGHPRRLQVLHPEVRRTASWATH